MIGSTLLDFVQHFPTIFIDIEQKNLSFLFKELIVMEIICCNQQSLTSKQIQADFIYVLSQCSLPPSLLEESKTATGKTNLKVLLNNILSSNLFHGNGLSNRLELSVTKERNSYIFTPSSTISNDIKNIFDETNDLVSIFDMGVFLKKYPYIWNILNFVDINHHHCQFNSNHLTRESIFPIFKNRVSIDSCSVLNLVYICDRCIVDLVNKEIYHCIERKP